MDYKNSVLLALFIFCNVFVFSQSLILDKINDIKVKIASSEIKQIIPLPDKQIAVSLTTSDSPFVSEFEKLSILSKDTSIQVFQHYYRPYEVRLIHLSADLQTLYTLKYNRIDDRKDFYLHTYELNSDYSDSLNIRVKFSYKNTIIHQNELIFFGRSEDNDSLLLKQVYNMNKEELTEVWIMDTVPKSLWWGINNNDQFFYALSTPTRGSNNPEISTNYLIYNSAAGYNQLVFNSSNEEHSTLSPVTFIDYNPIFPVNDSIVYVAYDARKPSQFDYNYIVASYNIKQSKVNWQYHGLDNKVFKYVKPTSKGVHIYYEGRDLSYYEFINSDGEQIFEDDNSELIRYCTNKDECIVYRNDTLFLKKFGEVLAYYAFENLDQYAMYTFHPDDKHHYVSLQEKGGSDILSIYQLKLDTLDTGIFNESNIEVFNLYPNPANTSVNLELPVFQKYDLEIINLNGQVVERLAVNGKVNVIQPQYLEEGTYWLKAIGQNDKTYVSRLLWFR